MSLLVLSLTAAQSRHLAKQARSLADAAAGTLQLSSPEPRRPLKRASVACMYACMYVRMYLRASVRMYVYMYV